MQPAGSLLCISFGSYAHGTKQELHIAVGRDQAARLSVLVTAQIRLPLMGICRCRLPPMAGELWDLGRGGAGRQAGETSTGRRTQRSVERGGARRRVNGEASGVGRPMKPIPNRTRLLQLLPQAEPDH